MAMLKTQALEYKVAANLGSEPEFKWWNNLRIDLAP